jgi:hypothetical protein
MADPDSRSTPIDLPKAEATLETLSALLAGDVSPAPWFVVPEKEVDGVRQGWPSTDTICHGDERDLNDSYCVAQLDNDNLREGDAALITALRNAAPLLLELAKGHVRDLLAGEARMGRLNALQEALDAEPDPPPVELDPEILDRMLADGGAWDEEGLTEAQQEIRLLDSFSFKGDWSPSLDVAKERARVAAVNFAELAEESRQQAESYDQQAKACEAALARAAKKEPK